MRRKYLTGIILLVISTLTYSQADLSGVWKLKTKTSISGPDYDNGVPKAIRINQFGNVLKIELTKSKDESDLVELDSFESNKIHYESLTQSGRNKSTDYVWNHENQTLEKRITLSAKIDHTNPEIRIIESYKKSTDSTLTFNIHYDGLDSVDGNQDYNMEGLYERTTYEELIKETARGNGVEFLKGLTWEQVLDKAGKEDKYVFVDFYATWCTPCKKMDRDVFPLNMVGDVLNKDFLSIKVQLDSTKTDGSEIKIYYPLARKFEKLFNIEALPTYMVFDPLGNPMHKYIGSITPKEVIDFAHQAKDPTQQIYTLYRRANEGAVSINALPALVDQLLRVGETKMAVEIARMYVERYFYRMQEQELYAKKNMMLLARYLSTLKSTDKLFKSMLKDPSRFDSLFDQGFGFTDRAIEYVIEEEEAIVLIRKARKENLEPDWRLIETTIRKKYGYKLAQAIVINNKVDWYGRRKDWINYCKNLVLQIELLTHLGKASWSKLNDAAWKMFEHGTDKKLLEKALLWSEMSMVNQIKDLDDSTINVSPSMPICDTYANLLYKLGRKEEAIKFYQKRILNVCPKDEKNYWTQVFNKIKNDQPTWPTDEAAN